MALLVRRQQDVLAMEGNEELEEGEARDSNDSNYGPDLNFPHLELKLTEVLGHVRKEFEDGACNEKQGSIYGGYGTFLPTEVRAPYTTGAPHRQQHPVPPVGATWPGRRSPPKHVAPNNTGISENFRKQPPADGGRDKSFSPPTKPSGQSRMAPDSGGEQKKPNSITLRIKMGSEAVSRGKNTAIYNGLGFSSPSVSEEEEELELSGAESSPYRSPRSILQLILSHSLPTGGLLSPLPEHVPEKVLSLRTSGATMQETLKDRKQVKGSKKDRDNAKDYIDDGVKEMDLDSKPIRQEKIRSRSDDLQGDLNTTDELSRLPVNGSRSAEYLAEGGKSYVKKEARPETKDPRNVDSSAEENFGKYSNKGRRDEVPMVGGSADKRKSKDLDVQRSNKKQKATSSTGSLNTDVATEKKKQKRTLVAEGIIPQPHSEPVPRAKDKKEKLAKSTYKAAPEVSDSSRKPVKSGSYPDEVGPSAIKVKRVKSRPVKKNKDLLELPVKEPLSGNPDVVPPAPSLQQGSSAVTTVPVEAPKLIDEFWVECENCNQWRLLPPNVDTPDQSSKWVCKMITWLPPGMNDCKYTEAETKEALYKSLGIYPLVNPPVPPAVPLALPEPELKPSVTKPTSSKKEKGLRSDDAFSDDKPERHASKRKDKPKQQDDFSVKSRDRDGGSEKKKKKKLAVEDVQVSKRMRTEEGQRARYPAEISNENDYLGDEDGETYRGVPGKKQNSKAYETSTKREKHDNRRSERGFEDSSHRVRGENVEEAEARASKYLKNGSTSKGKAIRVDEYRSIDNVDDWARAGEASRPQKVKDDEHMEVKRKKVVRSPRALSPCNSSERTHHNDTAVGTEARTYDSRKVAEQHNADYAEHEYRRIRDWEEGDGHEDWDDQHDVKQASRHRSWENGDRHRDSQDRDDFGRWARRTSSDNLDDRGRPSQIREEKHTSRHTRRPDGKIHLEYEENKPKVRLKHEEPLDETLCKYDSKGDARREAKTDVEKREVSEKRHALVDKDSMKDDNEHRQNKDRKKAAAETAEGKQDGDATSLIKAAKTLKHLADRIKDTYIYLQAGLKFMEGAALLERTSSSQPEQDSSQLYSDTASLFRFCAAQYERGKDLAGAILAHKCAAVARFRVLMVKNTSMSRDRADLQAALPRVPVGNQPPTGDSPSSSSASDLDNLNGQVMPTDKLQTAGGKGGGASPLVQVSGGNICLPAPLQPTLVRFINSTGDVFEAFEHWNKAESILSSVVAAKTLSAEALATVEKVGSIGFSDVLTLVRLVNQVLEALGR